MDNKTNYDEIKLKVLLVEDEVTILHSLEAVVQWESLGYFICGEAANYNEAVEIARNEKPDIMISDIMLGTNEKTGLDLVKEFSILLPQLKTILLTGYDSFEFAKDAIGYTVKAYLLKPLKINELEHSLLELRNEYIKDKIEEDRRKVLTKQIERAKPFLFDWLVSYGGVDEYDMTFGNCDNQNGWQPIIMRLKSKYSYQMFFELFLQLEDIYKHRGTTVNIFYNGNHLILLLRMESEQFLCNGGEVEDFLKDLQKFLDFYGGINYLLSIGHYVKNLHDVMESYKQALALSEYGKFIGNSKQIYYTDIASVKHEHTIKRFKDVNMKLRISIQTANSEEAVQIIKEYMHNAAKQGAQIGVLRSLAYEAFSILDEIKVQVGLEDSLQNIPEWNKLENCENLEQLLNCLIGDYTKVGEAVAVHQADRMISALNQVKRKIETHFSEDLSLENFAREVGISPTYLSTLFSEKFGMTFKNYIISVRMEAAKKMLAEGNQKVYLISEMIGYADTRYFSQVFKKYTGMTPLSYRGKFQK